MHTDVNLIGPHRLLRTKIIGFCPPLQPIPDATKLQNENQVLKKEKRKYIT